MARKRVFVAEDSLLILMALETILDQAEIEIAGSAASLAEALKLAETCDADVAILDVNLGDGMCFPAADILMARGIPIIFTTGYAPEKTLLARYAKAHAIEKPYEASTLLGLLAQSFEAAHPGA
ncbi:response regulator [Rhodoblastus sp.]|uniref:response regulator n=1 Tax=Rhodoblastus sp. TaxID=1962975 RepID=UPI003F9DFDF8